MSMRVKAKEQLQKVGTYAGKYRYVMMPELYTALTQDNCPSQWCEPRRDAGMLGCSRRCHQGMGNGRSLSGTAWTGYHALRSACQERRKRERREGKSDHQSPHHLHARHRPEGGTGEDRHPDHLLRPRRQGGEASHLNIGRGGRPG